MNPRIHKNIAFGRDFFKFLCCPIQFSLLFICSGQIISYLMDIWFKRQGKAELYNCLVILFLFKVYKAYLGYCVQSCIAEGFQLFELCYSLIQFILLDQQLTHPIPQIRIVGLRLQRLLIVGYSHIYLFLKFIHHSEFYEYCICRGVYIQRLEVICLCLCVMAFLNLDPGKIVITHN